MFRLSPVKVYDVQPPDASSLKLGCNVFRLIPVYGFRVVIALGKADTLAVDYIYCRNQALS